MKLSRNFDPAKLEGVMHHPDVKPFVSLGQEIPDLRPIIEDEDNYCLMNDHGGFLFVKHPGRNVYDVHTAFVPEGRGPHLLELAMQAREFMFYEVGAEMLRTFVSHDNKPARRLALASGFVDSETIELFGVSGSLMTMERKNVCQ